MAVRGFEPKTAKQSRLGIPNGLQESSDDAAAYGVALKQLDTILRLWHYRQ